MKNLFAFFLCIAAVACGGGEASSVNSEAAEKSESTVKIGQVLKTDYFDVTVNSAEVSDHVNTGDEMTSVPKEEGAKFLIIDLTLKNTDTESRMMIDGDVLINYNGKELKFDNTELIAEEGWGIIMDQINPLMTKKTKVVYKIPAEVKGPAYYNPGRSDSDQKIYLNDIQ
ncbi:MAG TPA: DUF4352 domain-containing protein [Chitinophagaceae bacterium]|nr:DUF4352 domain-containing protein [Chitinophagaceae bacterium]